MRVSTDFVPQNLIDLVGGTLFAWLKQGQALQFGMRIANREEFVGLSGQIQVYNIKDTEVVGALPDASFSLSFKDMVAASHAQPSRAVGRVLIIGKSAFICAQVNEQVYTWINISSGEISTIQQTGTMIAVDKWKITRGEFPNQETLLEHMVDS